MNCWSETTLDCLPGPVKPQSGCFLSSFLMDEVRQRLALLMHPIYVYFGSSLRPPAEIKIALRAIEGGVTRLSVAGINVVYGGGQRSLQAGGGLQLHICPPTNPTNKLICTKTYSAHLETTAKNVRTKSSVIFLSDTFLQSHVSNSSPAGQIWSSSSSYLARLKTIINF